MSTHNKGFYEDLIKFIFQLSSNTHLISSSVVMPGTCLLRSVQYDRTFLDGVESSLI